MYNNFERLLNMRGITAYKVAQDTGIAQSTLSEWKHGLTTPKVDKLIILAEYFDVDIKDLIYGEGEGNQID